MASNGKVNIMYKIHRYFKEIHVRTFYFLFSFLLTGALSYFFVDQLLYLLTNFFAIDARSAKIVSMYAPHPECHEESNMIVCLPQNEGISFSLQDTQITHAHNKIVQRFIFTDITEAFRTCLTLAFGLTFYIQTPFLLYHIWSFFTPSLFVQERKIFSKFCLLFISLYLLASLMIMSFIFPILWDFFLKFEITTEFLDIHCETRISSYISFLFKVSFITHLLFQIPFFFFLCVQFEFFSLSALLHQRRFIYWCVLLVSAVIAPPDFIIQSLLSCFFLTLLEICFFLFILSKTYRANRI